MAFVHTSKTRRSSNWRRGRKAEVQVQVKENDRRGDDNMKRAREQHVKDALDNFGNWD